MTAYRIIFALAAVYNIAFGLWAGLFPQAFFSIFELEPPRYPWIWACLGMVVGVYAVAYARAAWKPEDGDVLIGIGFLGKVLGPIGWVTHVMTGEVPPRTFPLILFNDLIWWFPFAFYLLRNTPRRGQIVCAISLAVHAVACAALMMVSGGTEAEYDYAVRQTYVVGLSGLWSFNWFFWVLSSLSLGAVFIVWGAAVVGAAGDAERRRVFALVATGCVVCLLGIPFDLTNEALAIAKLTDVRLSLEDFVDRARLCTILGAGIANGLYCLGGLLVSAAALWTGFQTGRTALVAFSMWIVGLALTAAAFIDHRPTMIAAGGGVMVLFLLFAAITAGQLGKARANAPASPPNAAGSGG